MVDVEGAGVVEFEGATVVEVVLGADVVVLVLGSDIELDAAGVSVDSSAKAQRAAHDKQRTNERRILKN